MAAKTKKASDNPCDKGLKCKYLTIEGTRYRTLLSKKFENRKNWEAPNPSHVRSYIPGTINEIYVQEGQNVREGDPLLTLEAMKMRNVITAPAAGSIARIHVSEEVKVPKGHLLIELILSN